MGRFKNLFGWELGDSLRLLLFLLGVPSLTYLLTVGYLKSQWEVSSLSSRYPPVYTAGSPLGSITAIHLFDYPPLSAGFWVLLSLLVTLFSVMTLRYDRENGYALSVYALPFTKGEIFTAKVISALVLSLLSLYIPLLTVDVFPNADILEAVRGVVFTGQYLHLLVFATYFVLFSISTSVLFSVLLDNMFLAFIASFFLLVLPFFAGLSWPPFSFIPMLSRSLSWASPFGSTWLFWGIAVPAALLLLSGLIFTRRDVL
ncbi:hypothetical protein [Thermococcus sp.]